MKVLLGSHSPRRREILSGINIEYTIVDTTCDETYPSSLKEGDIPLYIAKEKAEAYREQLQKDELLITADTIVWLDGEVLGKPTDEEDACRMLAKIAGKTHQVYTGVAVTTIDKQTTFVDRTDVTFRELTEEEIRNYVHEYHPLDKAGSYGIQEYIGMIGCISIHGSYFNVMGLPIHRLAEEIKKYLP